MQDGNDSAFPTHHHSHEPHHHHAHGPSHGVHEQIAARNRAFLLAERQAGRPEPGPLDYPEWSDAEKKAMSEGGREKPHNYRSVLASAAAHDRSEMSRVSGEYRKHKERNDFHDMYRAANHLPPLEEEGYPKITADEAAALNYRPGPYSHKAIGDAVRLSNAPSWFRTQFAKEWAADNRNGPREDWDRLLQLAEDVAIVDSDFWSSMRTDVWDYSKNLALSGAIVLGAAGLGEFMQRRRQNRQGARWQTEMAALDEINAPHMFELGHNNDFYAPAA